MINGKNLLAASFAATLMMFMSSAVRAEHHCQSKTKDSNETDVDCGGGECDPCAGGKTCQNDIDCQSMSCVSGKCAGGGGNRATPVAATCTTDADCKNGKTCVDSTCKKPVATSDDKPKTKRKPLPANNRPDGMFCSTDEQCESTSCVSHHCAAPPSQPTCNADLLTDNLNCGACGITCDTSQICVNGVCVVPPANAARQTARTGQNGNGSISGVLRGPPLSPGARANISVPVCTDRSDEVPVALVEGPNGDNPVWTGRAGTTPKPGELKRYCADNANPEEAEVPIVCQATDRWNTKNPETQEARQLNLDQGRASAAAPRNNWDGVWRRGACAVLQGSAKIYCVKRKRLCQSTNIPPFNCAAALRKGQALFDNGDYSGSALILENAYVNGCRAPDLVNLLGDSYYLNAEGKCDHAAELERSQKYFNEYLKLLKPGGPSYAQNKQYAEQRLAKIEEQAGNCQPCRWFADLKANDPECKKPPDPTIGLQQRFVQLELAPDFGVWGSINGGGTSGRGALLGLGGGLRLVVRFGSRAFAETSGLFGVGWPGGPEELRGFSMQADAGIGVRIRPDLPGEFRVGAYATFDMRSAYQPNHPEAGEKTRNRGTGAAIKLSVKLFGDMHLWASAGVGVDSHPNGPMIEEKVVALLAGGLSWNFLVLK